MSNSTEQLDEIDRIVETLGSALDEVEVLLRKGEHGDEYTSDTLLHCQEMAELLDRAVGQLDDSAESLALRQGAGTMRGRLAMLEREHKRLGLH